MEGGGVGPDAFCQRSGELTRDLDVFVSTIRWGCTVVIMQGVSEIPYLNHRVTTSTSKT